MDAQIPPRGAPAARLPTWIGIGLAALTLVTFYPAFRGEFVEYDDHAYIVDNPEVNGGLSRQGIVWAFTSRHTSNWHPVTSISHMLDCELFGVEPEGHHAVSVLIHIANVVLLFSLLVSLTGSVVPSALVAAWFGIHPLHVESVAWISERKDVLSTFFWLLAVGAYVEYAHTGRKGSYGLSALAFALGLLSKPMVVTLPVILLLLDCWPLGRADDRRAWGRLLLEKLPFFLMSAAVSVVTILVHGRSGTLPSLAAMPWSVRVSGALVAYQQYLVKTVWPTGLACPYLYRSDWPFSRVAGAAVLLAAITVAVLAGRRRFRCLPTGWLWYLVMVLPVSGLVQAGLVAMADRYTYLSLVGVFIMAAFGAAEAIGLVEPANRRRVLQRTALALAVAVTLLLAAVARAQVRVWQDSITLSAHAARVTEGNHAAWNNWGLALFRQGQTEEALEKFRTAVSIHPRHAKAHNNLGMALNALGRNAEALEAWRRSVELNATYVEPRLNLGAVLRSEGRIGESLAELLSALRMRPSDPRVHLELVRTASAAADAEAIAAYREALEISPGWVAAMNRLAWLLATRGTVSPDEVAEALRLSEKACRIEGGQDPDVLRTVAAAHAAGGSYGPAVLWATRALAAAESRNDPLLPQIRRQLALHEERKPFCRDSAPRLDSPLNIR